MIVDLIGMYMSRIVTLKHCLFAVSRGLTETVIMEIQLVFPQDL